MREQAEAAGVDTSSLKTRALAQLRSVNAEDLRVKCRNFQKLAEQMLLQQKSCIITRMNKQMRTFFNV